MTPSGSSRNTDTNTDKNTDTDKERDTRKAKDTATSTEHRHAHGHEDGHGLRHQWYGHGHLHWLSRTKTRPRTQTHAPRPLTLPLTWTRTRTMTQWAISFREQIAGLTNTCYYHLRQLRSIRRSLSFDSSHALVRALILSRLDYCNGLLGGASAALLDQMNGVMRTSARFILQKSRSSHITDEMNTRLHWLDIKARIDYKLCVTIVRCLNGLAPRYLARHCTLVSSVAGRAHLRSALSGMLVVPCSMQYKDNRSKGVCGVGPLLLEQSSSRDALQQ